MPKVVLSLAAVVAVAAAVALPAETAAMRSAASPAAVCAKETKQLNSFKRGMKAAKRRFFRRNASRKARARFVKQQKAKLKRLKRARKRCLDRQSPGEGPPNENPPGGGTPGGGGPGPPADPPATSAIDNVVSAKATFEDAEVSVEDEVQYVRTQLELELAPGATVPQLQALLARLNAEIVSSLDGIPVITVRIPDPGSLSALRALVDSLAGAPGLAHADIPTVPVTTELPSIIAPADVSSVRPQLASKAHAAWNARAALAGLTPPGLVVGDYWGNGPPGPEVAVQETASDFGLTNPHQHGYTILGLLAGTFNPAAASNTLADEVTGTWPGGDLTLRAVDLRLNIANSTLEDRLLQAVQALPGRVVINTSLAGGCAPAGCTLQEIQRDALQWIARVRGAGLENRFLHVSAAGNIYPNLQSDTNALLGAAVNAAARMTLPGGVPNLTNTIVVENTTASDPANGPVQPLCMTAGSKEGGHISAVGNDIKSLAGPGTPRDLPAGGTSSAAPQVAGAAAMVWALDSGLTPAEAIQILVQTAQPVGNSGDPRCKGVTPAPGLDQYSAVLAVDRAATQPVRSAILDVADSNGTLGAPDGSFDEFDVDAIVAELAAGGGAVDYGRFDLNGDGRTGGGTARLDLDGVRPVAWNFSGRRDVLGLQVLRDETAVRDLDVLCHEAAGPRYAGDLTARDVFLEQRCLPPVEIAMDPAFPASVQEGAATQLRVVARRSDIADPIAAEQPGVRLEFSASGGTVGAATGVTGADGTFGTTATLGASQNQLQVEIVARAGQGGPELDRMTVTANRAGTGSVTNVAPVSSVKALAEACAGRDGEGCTIETQRIERQLAAFGTYSDSASASEDESGSAGFYEGNFASANSSATQSSTIQAVGGPAEIVANGSASGSSTRVFGANASAHSAYSSQVSAFMRFTVASGSVPWTAQGTMSSSGTQTHTANFILYRTAPSFQLIHSIINQNVDVSGTLAPGTYEVAAGASCAADTPATCTASYDFTFDIDP